MSQSLLSVNSSAIQWAHKLNKKSLQQYWRLFLSPTTWGLTYQSWISQCTCWMFKFTTVETNLEPPIQYHSPLSPSFLERPVICSGRNYFLWVWFAFPTCWASTITTIWEFIEYLTSGIWSNIAWHQTRGPSLLERRTMTMESTSYHMLHQEAPFTAFEWPAGGIPKHQLGADIFQGWDTILQGTVDAGTKALLLALAMLTWTPNGPLEESVLSIPTVMSSAWLQALVSP